MGLRLARSALPLVRSVRSFAAHRASLAGPLERALYRAPALRDAIGAVAVGDPQRRYERWIRAYDTLSEDDLAAICARARGLPALTALVVPSSAASRESAASPSLHRQAHEPQRVVHLDSPTDLRAAVARAEGEFVLLVDTRVTLRPHALFLIADAIRRYPDASLVYGDDDVLGRQGRRSEHDFKPDWNKALLRGQNFIGGVVAIRRSVLLDCATDTREIASDPLWDLLLAVTSSLSRDRVRHLPFVISHRLEAREGDMDRDESAAALEERLRGLGERVRVTPVGRFSYATRLAPPDEPPHVSVIIPSTCDLEVLPPCVEGVLHRTAYTRRDLVIVANGLRGDIRAKRRYLDELSGQPDVRVVFDEAGPYNFSRVNNNAVNSARGDLVCFLNDDTEVIRDDWLTELVGHVADEGVAAVGAKLLFPNGRIQHGGIILGVGLVAGHAYELAPPATSGYRERAIVSQDLSAVTAACMLVRREAFLEVGGFDEDLAIAFNDIDLCLRFGDAGWRVVWTPAAELFHHGSASVGRHDARAAAWEKELSVMRDRWGDRLRRDPHYNANLSLDALELWQPAFPPRVTAPWRGQA